MLAQYLTGNKKVTLRQIDLQCQQENIQERISKYSFNKSYLKPLVAIPIYVYVFFFE